MLSRLIFSPAMEEMMFSLEIAGVCVFLALSLWASSKGEAEGQWAYLLAASLGWLLLLGNEYAEILDGLRLWYCVAYAGFSGVNTAHRLILRFRASSQDQTKPTEEASRPHDTVGDSDQISRPHNTILEKAEEILEE